MIDLQLANNLQNISQKIHNAKRLHVNQQITLLAVTKGKNAGVIRQAWKLGIKNFGENYIQEAVAKIELLADLPDINWHFIGVIQSNKVKYIAEYFSWIHSIDKLKTAKKLNEYLAKSNKYINVCIQVNINQEATKSGIQPNELDGFILELLKLPQLRLRGLMILPKAGANTQEQKAVFRQIAELLKQLNNSYNLTLDTLSMGMSADFELAIQQGATIVRIGTALFGARN